MAEQNPAGVGVEPMPQLAALLGAEQDREFERGQLAFVPVPTARQWGVIRAMLEQQPGIGILSRYESTAQVSPGGEPVPVGVLDVRASPYNERGEYSGKTAGERLHAAIANVTKELRRPGA